MNKRLAALAIVAVALAAAAGLFASPSNSAATTPYCKVPFCIVSLEATGPSPSKVKMYAFQALSFANTDSVSHTVVFANGRCTLTVSPGPPGWDGCKDNFASFVGTYLYTVDGKFPGTVVTTPLRRFVTLTARTHSIRGRTRLTLHGRVSFDCPRYCLAPSGRHYVSVTVLARNKREHRFHRIGTVNPRYLAKVPGSWTLTVQPGTTTTYIAKVTGQLPQGQLWTNAESHPFRVRIQD
jgi:hypothetical protein